MLTGVLVLLLCQLLGELVVRLTGLPVPGPVLGMLVFLVVLRWRRPDEDDPLVRGPQALLTHLQLLFVPAGVGVVGYLGVVRQDAWPIAGGLWVSWALGLVATAWVVLGMLRLTRTPSDTAASEDPGPS